MILSYLNSCIFTRLTSLVNKFVSRRFAVWRRVTDINRIISRAKRVSNLNSLKYMFDQWVTEFVGGRKKVRGLVNRMVGGKRCVRGELASVALAKTIPAVTFDPSLFAQSFRPLLFYITNLKERPTNNRFHSLQGGFNQFKRRALNATISVQQGEYEEMRRKLEVLAGNYELLQRDMYVGESERLARKLCGLHLTLFNQQQ